MFLATLLTLAAGLILVAALIARVDLTTERDDDRVPGAPLVGLVALALAVTAAGVAAPAAAGIQPTNPGCAVAFAVFVGMGLIAVTVFHLYQRRTASRGGADS